MTRILLLVLAFAGGAALSAGIAFGAFELLNPPAAQEKRGAERNDGQGQGEVRPVSERTKRLIDWIIGGAVVGGLIGLAAAWQHLKPGDEPTRPPVDFKIGDPPPDLR